MLNFLKTKTKLLCDSGCRLENDTKAVDLFGVLAQFRKLNEFLFAFKRFNNETAVTKMSETAFVLFYLSIILYEETCGGLEKQVINANLLSISMWLLS